MFGKMLKFTVVLLVLFMLMTFFGAPPSISSETSFTDKKCGEPLDSKRVVKKEGNCTAADNKKSQSSCENAKGPTYKVESAAGCTVDAPEHEGKLSITYYYCFEGEKIVEHGKVSCVWEADTCAAGTDYSITDKKFKTCREDTVEIDR